MSFHQVKYLDSYRGDFSLKNTRKQRGNFMAVHGHWSREAAQTHPWVVNSVWESCFVKTFDTLRPWIFLPTTKTLIKNSKTWTFFCVFLGKKNMCFTSFPFGLANFGFVGRICKPRWGKCIICCALSILTPQITGCFEDPIPAIQVQTLDPLGDQEHGRFKVWTTCVILRGVSSMSISLPGNSAGALFWDG